MVAHGTPSNAAFRSFGWMEPRNVSTLVWHGLWTQELQKLNLSNIFLFYIICLSGHYFGNSVMVFCVTKYNYNYFIQFVCLGSITEIKLHYTAHTKFGKYQTCNWTQFKQTPTTIVESLRCCRLSIQLWRSPFLICDEKFHHYNAH